MMQDEAVRATDPRLSVEDIHAMSYVDLISLLRETNRCPGGLQTIRYVAHETFLTPQSKVLDVGSNTGFTSLELARTARCSVVGVDVNAKAIAVAREVLRDEAPHIRSLVRFELASAYDLPFDDRSFDVVVAGGAFSFMDAKPQALREVVRVLKPWGYFSATNLCYLKSPDAATLRAVGNVIGTTIEGKGSGDWMALYEREATLERANTRIERLGSKSPARVAEYAASFAAKPHLACLDAPVRDAIIARWLGIVEIFNRNHEDLGYVSLVYRKMHIPQEQELFTPTYLDDAAREFQRPVAAVA